MTTGERKRTCQSPGTEPGRQHCGAPAVFSVLRRDFDPVRPSPRDGYDCCEAHLGRVIREVDEMAAPGYVVHVTVIASVAEKEARAQAAEA